MTKTCTHCRRKLDLAAFRSAKSSWCKECHNAAARQSRERRRDRDDRRRELGLCPTCGR